MWRYVCCFGTGPQEPLMAPYNALMMPNNMRSWAIQFSPVTYYLSFFNFHKMESFIQKRWFPINSNTWQKIKLVFIYTIVINFYATMVNIKINNFGQFFLHTQNTLKFKENTLKFKDTVSFCTLKSVQKKYILVGIHY